MRLFEESTSRRWLSGQALVAAAWLGVTAVGAWLSPDPSGHGTHTQLGLPPCPSALLFSRPCPGCGLTTSFTATIHGRLSEAFSAHALGPLIYLGFTAYALLGIYGLARSQRLRSEASLPYRVQVAAAVLFLGFGIIRAVVHPGFADGPEQRFLMGAWEDRGR